MVAGYDAINKFIKNIYYAKGLKLDEDFLPMWIREISITGADITDLQQAETEIIRNNIPPKIYDVCNTITKIKRSKLIPITTNGKCKYCGGKGYVYTNLYFDKTGNFLSDNYALACICNPKPNCSQMQLNDDHNKTFTDKGYFRCFANSLQQNQYLQKVAHNHWRDIK